MGNETMWLRCIVVKLTLTGKKPRNSAYPNELKTLGDHLRKVRLDKGLSQPEVAKVIKVETDSITNWEMNRNVPTPKFAKRIISFLGYLPFDLKNMSLGQQIYHMRLIKGVSQDQLAEIVSCDESNLRLIELDKRRPGKETLIKLEGFVLNKSVL